MQTFREGNLVRCTASDLPAPLHRGQLYKVIQASKSGKVRLNTTFPPGFKIPVWAEPDKVKMELVSASATIGNDPEVTESPEPREIEQAAQLQPQGDERAPGAATEPQTAFLQGAEVYMFTAEVNDRILVELYADENAAADRADDLALVFAKLNLDVGTRTMPMEVK